MHDDCVALCWPRILAIRLTERDPLNSTPLMPSERHPQPGRQSSVHVGLLAGLLLWGGARWEIVLVRWRALATGGGSNGGGESISASLLRRMANCGSHLTLTRGCKSAGSTSGLCKLPVQIAFQKAISGRCSGLVWRWRNKLGACCPRMDACGRSSLQDNRYPAAWRTRIERRSQSIDRCQTHSAKWVSNLFKGALAMTRRIV